MKVINKTKTINKVLNVHLVVDSSGSMSPYVNNVRKYIKEQVDSLRNNDVKVLFTLYSFSTTLTQISDSDVDIRYNDIDTSGYKTEGNTALSDAIYTVLSNNLNRKEPNLLVLVTDGEENASSVTTSTVSKLISKAIATDYWTIAIAGPTGSKQTLQRHYSAIPDGCITEWEVSSKGMATYSSINAVSNRAMLSTVRSGATKSASYYVTPDIPDTKAIVKSNLDDVSKNYSIHGVNSNITDEESVVSTYVTKKLKKKFAIGSVYYQHTKRETIQDYKNIILMDKATNKLYSGEEVRNILNIPDNTTVKLEPSCSNKYTLFIRSTSYNRKLVPGTTILLAK